MLDDPLTKSTIQPTRKIGHTFFPGRYNAVVRDMTGKKIGQFDGEAQLNNFLAGCLSHDIYIIQIYNCRGHMVTYKLIRKP